MTELVPEATVVVVGGADPRAVGGAIAVAVALCGLWEREPPCRWPHHTDVSVTGGWHEVRAGSTADPVGEPIVRQENVAALESGQQAGPDGEVSRGTPPRRGARGDRQAGSIHLQWTHLQWIHLQWIHLQ